MLRSPSSMRDRKDAREMMDVEEVEDAKSCA